MLASRTNSSTWHCPDNNNNNIHWLTGHKTPTYILTQTWLFSVLDAFGKPVPGLLEGNINLPGGYQQCFKVRANTTVTAHPYFSGQYCTAVAPLAVSGSRHRNIMGIDIRIMLLNVLIQLKRRKLCVCVCVLACMRVCVCTCICVMCMHAHMCVCACVRV